MKPCPIGQTCVISGDSGICVDIKEKVSVGGECKSSEDCKRGLCTNNICTPIEDGENCQDDKSCKGGSSCSSNKCVKQKDAGEECSRDLDCKIGLICSDDRCIRFASIPDGGSADHPWTCMSMRQRSYRCRRVDVLPECDNSNKCKAKYDGDQDYKNENCVLNYNHNYVCSNTGQSYFDSFAKIYNKTLDSLSEEESYEI